MNRLLFSIKRNRYFPIVLLFSISLILSFITRIALLISFGNKMDVSFSSLLVSFAVGFLYDGIVALLLVIPFTLHITFTNNFIYTSKGKWVGVFFFTLLLFLVLGTSLIPQDFNKELYKGIVIYILLRLLIYLLLLFQQPSFRTRWRYGVLQLFFSLVLFILLFNVISEWFFWNEFSSRYNFIAVDYLIYTSEVIGNIRESYPIYRILLLVLLVTLTILHFTRKAIRSSVQVPILFGRRLLFTAVTMIAGLALALYIPSRWKYFSKNNYANELAGNGIYDFVQAFKSNELDFFTYYKTLPDTAAFTMLKQELGVSNSHFISGDLFDLSRQISYPDPEKHMNVVLISVESLSASFMQSFGNQQHITPCLDSLAEKGWLFTRLYASGTRTVRGLEALSLSIPPLPGQSIVKRPNNENLFSLGFVFKQKGYITQYIYGGYGYFDNMNYFFGNNNYTVIDRTALQPAEVHYANIWGVADEDLFTLALRTMDNNYNAGKPFFTQVMTVSNHRPFTYPDGRIDILSSVHSREGAVKYTDYAIGRFIREAAQKPWFSNTLFVVVADHCASSAGKQELPLPGYHIPMIIYAPATLHPQHINSLMGQIDIAPTILGMLNFNYQTHFFGQDIFHLPPEKQRVFISTYQGLGFLKGDTLIVQSPVKKIKAYKVNYTNGEATEITVKDSLLLQAISYYQAAAWLIKYKKYSGSLNNDCRMLIQKVF